MPRRSVNMMFTLLDDYDTWSAVKIEGIDDQYDRHLQHMKIMIYIIQYSLYDTSAAHDDHDI